MESVAKAYGKVLIFGSYAILEPGNLGLVVTLDKGTTTTAQETKSGKILVDMKSFEISVKGTVDNFGFRFRKGPGTLKFVKNAVDYTYKYLKYKDAKLKDVRIITFNDPELYFSKELKTGLGTSATTTVSTVATILNMHNIDDRDIVYKISKYSHYKSQDNTGSGFDIGAACYGSHYFISEPSPDPDFFVFLEKEIPNNRLGCGFPPFMKPLLVFTGKSASTTRLVKKVLDFKKKNPKDYVSFMTKYNEVSHSIKRAMTEGWKEEIKHFLEKSWQMRKHLGEMVHAPIEPTNFTNLLDDMMLHGALTAGLAGAGGGDSIIAFYENEVKKAELFEFLGRKNLQILEDVNIADNSYEILA